MKFQALVLLLLTALFQSISLTAQPSAGSLEAELLNPARIYLKGKVVEAGAQAPLSYATVSLFGQADSTLIGGNITDEAGQFSLEVKPGAYYIVIEFLAFQPKTIPNIIVSKGQPEINLGVITLEPEATALEEVIVVGEKSQMQLSLDKKVFNVGKDLASRGGSAADLLDNVPSVQVDVEGNVSLRGGGSVRILIDGKPSGLIGMDGASGLRQLQANMIERVEVITNPSARYEAEGMAGIINIVLKKERQAGTNGSFDLTAGYPDNYGAAINLNYRTDKLNLFSNYGIFYRQGPGGGSSYQEVYSGDTTFITQQNNDRLRGGLSQNIRVGADYFFNPRNILTTAFNLRLGNENNQAETRYRDYLYSLGNPTGITLRTDDEQEDETNIEYALTYKKTFEQEGREFTFDARYQDNTEKEGSDLANHYYTPEFEPDGTPDLLQRSDNKESERQFILQADYVHPLGKNGKFEAGLRSSLRNIDNDYLVTEFTDDEWITLEGLSNNFQYDENIHAAYLMYGNKLGRFSWQLGLRPEYSQVTTRLLQTDEVNDRSYLNLFPSAHFSYELPGQNAVQVSYSRRVRRPRFWDLNPFFTFSDDRNYFSGNPNLDPEFTNSMELGHLKYWDNASLSSSIYYRHTDGKIDRIRTVNDDGTSITQPENLLSEDAFGLEFTASWNPYKWWKLNGDFNFFRAITDGGNLGDSFESDTYSWFARTSSRFTLWNNTDVQLRFNYRAPQETAQGLRKSMYGVDLAASRDILQDKGTLTLSVRDVFNTNRFRFQAEGENFFTANDFQWRARQITLSFSYRLNQKKQRGGQGNGGEQNGGGEEMGF
ncbi:MAG: TonB-dependent receptor [Lewinellaceae bacterium]|nr:TonB-dependent receptor [Lewinellaceae bacterium]